MNGLHFPQALAPGFIAGNRHPLVVLGQLLDWLSTSMLATVVTAWWRHR